MLQSCYTTVNSNVCRSLRPVFEAVELRRARSAHERNVAYSCNVNGH